MLMTSAKKHRILKRTLIAVAVVLAILAGAFAWYVSDYNHADETALAVMADANGAADGVEVRELPDGSAAFVPKEPVAGLVFYPGGKVQPEAYAPLLERLAQDGILCVLVRPPFNLAIFAADAADAAIRQFPEIETWLAAGHSLGGVAAGDYTARHQGDIDGVVFLAAYPAADLSGYGGGSLTLVGTNDGIVNRSALDAAGPKMPADALSEDIEGGNHAYFGNYGEQAGDGKATITREEQQAQTVQAIKELADAA